MLGIANGKLGEMFNGFEHKQKLQQEEFVSQIKKERLNQKKDKACQLWNGNPDNDNSKLLCETVNVQKLLEFVPIAAGKLTVVDLEVGEWKKIDHGKLLDKNGNELDLYLKQFSSAKEYEANNIFPLTNPKKAGKEGKGGNGGGEATKPFALYKDINNGLHRSIIPR